MRFAGGFGRPFSFAHASSICRTIAPPSIHSTIRPSIREKNVCNRKKTGVTCAPIAAALRFIAARTPRIPAEPSNETRLPHRQPVRHVALPPRCGRMRAVEGLRPSAHAARQRHTPRLIPFRRSVTPISEARERPRIPIRGLFVSASANTVRKHAFLNPPSESLHRNARKSFVMRAVSRCRSTACERLHRNPLRSILSRTPGHRSPRRTRSRGIHHEARKCCVAMLDAGGGGDSQDVGALTQDGSTTRLPVGDRPGTSIRIRAAGNTGTRLSTKRHASCAKTCTR